MTSLDNCFVDKAVESVKVIDVGRPQFAPVNATATATGTTSSASPAAASTTAPAPAQAPTQGQPSWPISEWGAKTLPELTGRLHGAQADSYSCRLISICQRTSWRPLQITKPMMEAIVSAHSVHASFWDITSCFYTRNLELEEVYCVPYTENRTGDVIEISYTVRYPEYKTADAKWVIRQTGLYHRFNAKTCSSTYVLLSPTPNSKLHQEAAAFLSTLTQGPETEPFWLHRLLFATYFPAWRRYIAALERQFLPIANSTFATYIDEPLRICYDNLSALVSLETRFLLVPAVLGAATETLDELAALLTGMSPAAAAHPGTQQLRNISRQCGGYCRAVTHLQQRTQRTAQLLSDTLLFRDQVVAKEQNGNMLQLNKSAVFITTLTLLYLPASFVSSFFGMNFFGFDGDNNRIAGSSMVWIYVLSSALLTAITFFFYYWLLHRENGAAFRRLAPKIADWSLKDFGRRLTANNTNNLNTGDSDVEGLRGVKG
ncbi:hypothetical protein B0H63DRAFT_214704 [Podospora didyma]|uniref:CorA-like transporter domain-containing protein n=1 Tax=Podospora didyma TaxID=330526 RepID=A0AAE0NI26_9PEZI|nr:hypothetical protein B0H63DRAFT_214704 [Podospora didyma]